MEEINGTTIADRKRSMVEENEDSNSLSASKKPKTIDASSGDGATPPGTEGSDSSFAKNEQRVTPVGVAVVEDDVKQTKDVKLEEEKKAIDKEAIRSQREERRLETNRLRAKDIRKRKKKMVEDMQQQIILLTMENNKLRVQNQIQQNEIALLHSALKPSITNQHQLPQQRLPPVSGNGSSAGLPYFLANQSSFLE